jgi:hypothetical protein
MVMITIIVELKTTYKLLLVQDVCTHKTLADLRDEVFTTWTSTMVDDARYEYLHSRPGAKGLIILNESSKVKVPGKVNVYVDEWVCHATVQPMRWQPRLTMSNVKFYLFTVSLHKPGLFEVEVMAWDEMRTGLQHNRTDFTAQIAESYDCVVAFPEIGLDLQ